MQSRFFSVVMWSVLMAACGYETPDVAPRTSSFNDNFAETTRTYLQALVAEKRSLELASDAYLKAFEVQPTSLVLHQKAYAYALASGHMETAVKLAKDFTPAHTPGSIAWLLLAMQEVRAKNYDNALMYIKRAQQVSPELLHFQVLKNQIELAQGRGMKSIRKELENFETYDFLEARRYYYLARMYQRAGDAKHAMTFLAKAQSLEPGALFTVKVLGEMLEQIDETDAAAVVYRTFIAKNPDAMLLHDAELRLARGERVQASARTLEQDAGEVLFGFAMLMWAQQLDVPARQLLQMALWMEDNPLYRFYAGTMEEQAEAPDAALAQYRQVPTDGPAGLAAQVRVAEITFQQGDDKGVVMVEKLRRLYPEVQPLDRMLAEMYYTQKEYHKAVAVYDALLATLEDPEQRQYVPLYFARGSSYERLRQFDKAEEDFEKAIALDPENPSLLNYLGYMWLDADMKLDKAFAYISKASLLRPTDASIVDSLGWAYYKKGEYARALLYLERAAELSPMDATIIEHLGDVHLKLGDVEKARNYWQQAWDLGPAGTFEKERLAEKLEGF